MAYLDLTLTHGTPVAAPHDVAAAFGVQAAFQALGRFRQVETLSALEWRVVELAQADGLKSLQPVRKRSRLGRLVLGPTPPSKMLADERLEALRRLAVHAWHAGYTLPASAIGKAIKAGYTDLQVGAVIDTIVGRRLETRGTSA
jgi:hypothetical protein